MSSIWLYRYQSIYIISFCQSIYWYLSIYVYICIYQSTYLSIYQFIYEYVSVPGSLVLGCSCFPKKNPYISVSGLDLGSKSFAFALCSKTNWRELSQGCFLHFQATTSIRNLQSEWRISAGHPADIREVTGGIGKLRKSYNNCIDFKQSKIIIINYYYLLWYQKSTGCLIF